MPFTPTHMLAVIPIAKIWPRRFPLSALLIGSMVPDWPLFVPVGPHYTITHTWPGIFSVCVPIGLILYLFFHRVLKRALFELLPGSLRQRLYKIVESPIDVAPGGLVRVAAAIALGAVTHIVWDAFTHQGRWGTVLFPGLNQTAFSLGATAIPYHAVLQHGSSVLGLPLLLGCILLWLRSLPPVPAPPVALPQPLRIGISAGLVWVPLAVAVVDLTAEIGISPLTPSVLKLIAFSFVTRAGLVLLLLMVGYGVLFHAFMAWRISGSVKS